VSEQAFEGQGYEQDGGDQGFEGGGWDGDGGYTGGPQVDPFSDDFDQQLGSYIDSRIEPIVQGYHAFTEEVALADAEALIEAELTGHAERLGVELDGDAVRELANQNLVQAAYDEIVKAGYPHETAVQVVSQPSAPGLVLEAVHGVSQPDIARAVLAMMAEQLAPTRGDESAVLAKYTRLQAGSPQGRSTSQADLKGDETAVLRKYFPHLEKRR